MEGWVKYARQNSDFSVLNVSYASTRLRIGEHAETLRSVIDNVPEAERIHFVGHSMGNLVIRHFIGDLLRAGDASAKAVVGRIGRVVMVSPPNHGAVLAGRFRHNSLFQLLWGGSGIEIAKWDLLSSKLATPPGEFGILAGGKGDAAGFSPLIDGDDDFVVAVSETRLAGASDFLVIPAAHALMMDHPDLRAASLRFLKHGYFISADQKDPIRE
jgi:pimeloyl-ACP methyl ester carboxylesterase